MKNRTNRNRSNPPLARLVLVLALALLIAGVAFLITPWGRAWAQDVLRYFTRAQSDSLPTPTGVGMAWVEQTPNTPAPSLTPQPTPPGPAFATDCGEYASPRCSLEQIRARVSFPVMQFASLPQGWVFVGATGGPDHVSLVYRAGEGMLFLSQEPWTSSLDREPWQVSASAVIETVPVSGVTAEYVRGSYASSGGRDPAAWNAGAWDADADVQHLRWVEQDILFTLQLVGEGSRINRDALAELAGTLALKAAATLPPAPTAQPQQDPLAALQERYPLAVEEAAAAAGLIVHQPTTLPEVLRLFGAQVEPGLRAVTIFYHFEQSIMGPSTDGLTLSQQPITAKCALCSFVREAKPEVNPVLPGKIVGRTAVIEKVQLHSGKGQYVEGVWTATNDGWSWEPEEYVKRLRWEAGGMAYELVYFGTYLGKEDLIKIAQGIQ